MMMEDLQQADICRVCRSEGSPDRPLFHPCICTGSIKYIHQECLVQWMRYSRKEYCELCSYRFSFTPIYSPDMPKRLPIKDIISGLLASIATAVKYWFHYTLVAFAWLGVVPLTACRIYRCLFTGSVNSVLTLPLDMLSTENMVSDIFHGCFVVMCTLFAFIGLVWLREQILHGGGPDWLEQDNIAVEPAPMENNNVGVADAGNQQEVPAGPPEEDNNAPGQGNNVNQELNNDAQDEVNWNPIEWDRAAEELTWERLLGLDGSLVFLEHVFWVVSLNTLFILVFAFCPYHIGHFTVMGFKMRDYAAASHFEGLVTTLCGYCVIGLCLVILHAIASLLRLRKSKRVLGLCYVVVKVSLLSVVEIGVLPLICGWWLDICSLSMFDATLKDRELSFKLAPGTSMFIHWLVGMVYVYYFASFILLLREVLRPGVLWFLRNLNDPDFSPIQEMIHLPILRHVRRLLASMVIFGTAVLLMLWLPVHILHAVWPSFLPYTIVLHSEAQVSELSLELLLLQVILPALLEQSHTRGWLKGMVRAWCQAIAWLLDLRSYLLGDVPLAGEESTGDRGDNPLVEELPQRPVPPPPPVPEQGLGFGGGLGAAHQALLQREGPTGFQPYNRPNLFAIRIVFLLAIMCVSLMITSLVSLTLPVWLGRNVMSFWVSEGKIHELYTAACGMYMCWLITRAVTLLVSWLPQGWAAIYHKLQQWAILSAKSAVAFSVLLGIIPLLFGLLLELVVVVPLRVPLNQTPIFYIWQDWALGVLYTKITCAITMMGPNWWFKQAIERSYQDGIRNMNLTFILWELALPVIVCFGLALTIPYIISQSLIPWFVINPTLQNLIARRLYPFLLLAVLIIGIVTFQVRQFRKLYEHIKNDKYLVGRRLVNYDHRRKSPSQYAEVQSTQ